MLSNVLGDPTQIRIGGRVTVAFADVTEEVTLPVFRLLPDHSGAQPWSHGQLGPQ